MSNTHVDLSWSVLVADSDRWTPEQRAAADADEMSLGYDGYAAGLVAEAMREAGEAVMAAHPEMFVLKELI